MIDKNNIDYFRNIDNFSKINNIPSKLVYGKIRSDLPLITVLIPTFKRRDFLKEAIESAIYQVGFADYEILILDNDPSTNCEVQHLIESLNNDKILYYKNVENLGMFGNWNRGFELVRSKWVVLLHDDDVISPYFLAYCSPYLTNDSIGIIKPENSTFSGSTPKFQDEKKRKKLTRITLLDFIWGCAIGAPTNIVFNKKNVLKLGGFNQDYYPTSDYVFSARCSQHYLTYKLPVVLGGYRVEGNASLNLETMRLYFKNRYFISSFIMKKLNFSRPIISILQSYLVPKATKFTNDNYKTTFVFGNKDLELADNSFSMNLFVRVLEVLVFCVMKLRRFFLP